MTSIAVTGASGFIGRHVLAALAARDVDVVAHARTPRSEPGATRRRWVGFALADSPSAAFDWLGRPDIVIHLAWEGLPNYLSPRHVEVELPLQLGFLHGLAAAGLKRLVVAGTCFEYGMQTGRLHEDMAQPSNPYGAAKDALRRELESLSKQSPLDLRWLRLFYLYGEGQSPTSLYSLFRAAVARGDRRFDMSPGDQTRDFMAIPDAAAAIVDVALADRAPGIVNVCSGAPCTVRELVERWRREMGSSIELNPGALGYPSYEPFAFWGDNSRLTALRGQGATRAGETRPATP
jgi:dTDP-6-deoxy-L-talose 4-dehydrogenase (NAD+)